MAANFWASSHYRQLLDPDEVDVVHPVDKERGITQEEFRLIKIHMSFQSRKAFPIRRLGSVAAAISEYFSICGTDLKVHRCFSIVGSRKAGPAFLFRKADIWRLAQQVKVRQRVIATATTYFRRVYTRKSMTEYDPRIVAPTCLYLASKAEESTVQARLLVFYIKKMCCSDKRYLFEIKDILEMEMKLLEALDYYLIVYHPYRPLLQLLQDAGITDLTPHAWGLVNDTYKMDLILIYPPYMIALACIYIASVLKDKDTTAWFEELRVDMNVVKNISMDILDFYDTYKVDPQKGLSEERINPIMNKLPSRI